MQINSPSDLQISVTQQDVAYYLGYGKLHKPEPAVAKMIDDSIAEMKMTAKPMWVFEEYDLSVSEPESEDEGEFCELNFADISLKSRDLGRNLKNCTKLILVAVTAGAKVDALIRKTQMIDSAKSSVMQATGAAFAENTIEELNRVISEKYSLQGWKTHPRYSPGYGDVPLEFQKEFFRLLPCSKINLTLMDSLIMAPEKSVTAFIGLEKLL